MSGVSLSIAPLQQIRGLEMLIVGVLGLTELPSASQLQSSGLELEQVSPIVQITQHYRQRSLLQIPSAKQQAPMMLLRDHCGACRGGCTDLGGVV